MKPRTQIKFYPVIFIFLFSVPAIAKDVESQRKKLEEISQQMTQGVPIELKALEIRAKIHEPTVIYILDRPKLDVEFDEKEIKFSPRIKDPILKNRF